MHIIASKSDITQLPVDDIVNAANSSLIRGGGVCGAIFRAAGHELTAACVAIGGCPTGESRITPGFKLPAKFVIHAVGPVWHGGHDGEPKLLAASPDTQPIDDIDKILQALNTPTVQKTGNHGVGAEETAQPAAPTKNAPAKKAPAPNVLTEQPDVPAPASVGIAGKAFLFTGTLTTLTRAEAEQQVKAQGGTVLASVSDALDYLVVGEKAGSKLAKAKKIPSITVLSEDQFRQLYGQEESLRIPFDGDATFVLGFDQPCYPEERVIGLLDDAVITPLIENDGDWDSYNYYDFDGILHSHGVSEPATHLQLPDGSIVPIRLAHVRPEHDSRQEALEWSERGDFLHITTSSERAHGWDGWNRYTLTLNASETNGAFDLSKVAVKWEDGNVDGYSYETTDGIVDFEVDEHVSSDGKGGATGFYFHDGKVLQPHVFSGLREELETAGIDLNDVEKVRKYLLSKGRKRKK